MRNTNRWTLALLATWFFAGCSSGGGTSPTDAGTGGSEPADAGEDAADAPMDAPDCGALVWSSPACTSCTNEACCSGVMLCLAISTCAPLNACWNACGADAGCTSACGSEYVDAISNYNAILNCQRDSCASACASE